MPPTTPFPLGRRIEHDPASKLPRYRAAMATTLANRTHRRYGNVLDQGSVGSCTGMAISAARNCVPLRQARPILNEPDAVRAYSRATALDVWDGTYEPDDTGSSGLAVCKAAREFGWIDAYRHAFGLDEALAALVVSPIIIGVPWHEAFFWPDSSGLIRKDNTRVVGGHAVCVRGISVTNRTILAVNSWSDAWGVDGHFRMSWDLFGELLAEDGDVTVPTTTYRAP